MSHITAIGLGSMGTALVTKLLGASARVTIWNRSADRPSIKTAVEAGARFEPDIKSAITADSDAIMFCVLDYEAIYALLSPLASGDFLAGKTIVNLTNGTPKQAEEMDAWMKKHGAAAYYDGAVMVTPEMVHSPHSLVIYSGESQEKFDSFSNLVAPLGNVQYYGEKVGAAAAVDLAALAGMYGMFLGGLTGMNLLKQHGMKALPGTEQVTQPMLAALTGILTQTANNMDDEHWLGGSANPLAMQVAGLGNIIEACEDAGVDGTPFALVADMMRKALLKQGHDAGIAAAVEFSSREELSS